MQIRLTPMTGNPEELAATPNFATDAFSEVFDIVHVRGDSARVIETEGPLEVAMTQEKPCVYIVKKGQLDIVVGSEPPVILYENQIALLLKGTRHRAILTDNRERTPPEINCFWGSFSVDGDLAAQMLQSLPQVIVLEDLSDNPIEWVDVVCDLVLREVGATRPGASLMVSRLLDLLLVIILRRWAQSDDKLPAWLAAAKDERIARTVAAIHSDPSRDLTNDALAKLAGMSKSSFVDRFKQIMGQQPGAYLRAWRLDQAAEALLHSSASIDTIAERVGYASKEAFSRAFQAKFKSAPSVWRARHER